LNGLKSTFNSENGTCATDHIEAHPGYEEPSRNPLWKLDGTPDADRLELFGEFGFG
jgi:hypothetical protein